MINLLIALAAGAAAYGLTGFLMGDGGFNAVYGILPGAIALIGIYLLLARRSLKQVEAIMTRAQNEMAATQAKGAALQEKVMDFQKKANRLMAQGANPRSLDAKKARSLMEQQAELQGKQREIMEAQGVLQEEFREASLRSVEIMKEALPLSKWQFLIDTQINGQIGTLYYLNGEEEKSEPFLRNSFSRNWIAQAMLGALLYKRGELEEMNAVFSKASQANAKEGLVWAAWAWCAWKGGDTDKAIGLLGRGRSAGCTDERLQLNLLALQNGGDLDMSIWGELWYQLLLETPTMEADAPKGAKGRIPYTPRQGRSKRGLRG